MAITGRGRLYPPVTFKEGRTYGIDEFEWARIIERMGRNPNDMECAIFAMLWSEAYCNKSSASLLDTIAREDERVKKVPGTRLKAVSIGDGEYLTMRLIANNSQSYIDTYFGAQTAMDMSLTELATVGATPLATVNMFRFGSSEQIANQRLLQGAANGVSAYANRFGVPVIGGEVYFHKQYNFSVMANSGSIGVISSDHPLKQERPPVGSAVLYVGAKTGRDGLPTKEREEDLLVSRKKRESVTLKISDPLLASRMISACAEAISLGIVRDIISAGVGGLGTAAFDLASRINNPIRIEIDKIPLRVDGLTPKEILLSESSERLLIVATKGEHRKLIDIFHKWDIDSSMVGQVIDADGIEFYWNHYLAADIPFLFAMGGSIQKHYQVVKFPPMLRRAENADGADAARRRKRKVQDEWSVVREASEGNKELPLDINRSTNLEDTWLDLLANPNLCSRRPLYRLCDQVVGCNSLVRAGGDAGVLRLKEDGKKRTRGEDGSRPKKALAVTLDSNSLYVGMEPYLGTVQTVAEGMRNLAATGAKPIAIAHCLNFGDPSRYKEVCDLSESIRGLGDASRLWDIPIISEFVSLYNGSEGNPTLPAPAVMMVGLIEDTAHVCSVPFKERGDRILFLGKTLNELGCSEFGHYVHRQVNRLVPDINFDNEKAACDLVVALIRQGLLQSAHDCSGGGAAVALAECCLSGERPIGATLTMDNTLDEKNFRTDAIMFSETSGRFIISCKAEHEDAVRAQVEAAGVPITGSGEVGGRDMRIAGAASAELPLATAYKIWSRRMSILLGTSGM